MSDSHSTTNMHYSRLSVRIPSREILDHQRMDPKFFAPIFQKNVQSIKSMANKRGWNVVRLGDLVAEPLHRGGQPKYIRDGDVPVVKTADVQNDWVDWGETLRTSSQIQRTSRSTASKDELLITSTGEGSWGRASICDAVDCVVDGHITCGKIDAAKVDPFYALAFLWTKEGYNMLRQRVRGCTGQTELYPSDIAEVLVPIPNARTHAKIATYLKDSLSAKRRAECELAEASRLFHAGLQPLPFADASKTFTYSAEACQKSARNDPRFFLPFYGRLQDALRCSSCSTENLGALLLKPIWRGVSPKYDAAGKVPLIKTADVQNGLIDMQGCEHVSESFWESNKRAHVQTNDVVMTCTGEGSWGRTGIVLESPAVTTPELSVLRPDAKKIHPFYLCFFFWTNFGSQQIRQIVRGCTGQTHVYPSDLDSVVVPLLPTQERIGDHVRSCLVALQESKDLKERGIQALRSILNTHTNTSAKKGVA